MENNLDTSSHLSGEILVGSICNKKTKMCIYATELQEFVTLGSFLNMRSFRLCSQVHAKIKTRVQ
jgi:hypothetical protein